MRRVFRCLVGLAGVGTLAACSNVAHVAEGPAASAPITSSHGFLAAGDEVGRAAFRDAHQHDERMVSVPIIVD